MAKVELELSFQPISGGLNVRAPANAIWRHRITTCCSSSMPMVCHRSQLSSGFHCLPHTSTARHPRAFRCYNGSDHAYPFIMLRTHALQTCLSVKCEACLSHQEKRGILGVRSQKSERLSLPILWINAAHHVCRFGNVAAVRKLSERRPTESNGAFLSASCIHL